MKVNILPFLTAIFIISCISLAALGQSGTWSNAEWIGLEALEAEMRIVPGVHGFGDHLGKKGIKRCGLNSFKRDLEW